MTNKCLQVLQKVALNSSHVDSLYFECNYYNIFNTESTLCIFCVGFIITGHISQKQEYYLQFCAIQSTTHVLFYIGMKPAQFSATDVIQKTSTSCGIKYPATGSNHGPNTVDSSRRGRYICKILYIGSETSNVTHLVGPYGNAR